MNRLKRRLGLWWARRLMNKWSYHKRKADRLHRRLIKFMTRLERPRLLGGE